MLNSIKSITEKFRKNKSIGVLFKEIEFYHNMIKVDDGGGCSIEKAAAMAEFIKHLNFKVSADIGVYRGRSLFPQAIAHKLYTSGVAYGIDPYSNEAAVQNDREDLKEVLNDFATTTDFEEIYLQVQQIINQSLLQENCKIIRKKSSEASAFFKENKVKIELLHIDGNHDTYYVMEDIMNYLPLLASKAILILDDISWHSVKPAVQEVEKSMALLGALVDDANDFSIYSKGFNAEENKALSSLFKKVIAFKKMK